jgi:polysaccharide biosynthesis protein VpsJ
MTASVGEQVAVKGNGAISKGQIFDSLSRLCNWLEINDYRGYDTFDGLSAKYLRPLTFNSPFLRQVLQQAVRRFPINVRPLLGIGRHRSTKGMGFIARGFMRLHDATGDAAWQTKAESALAWLLENPSKGYSGLCWGNHFDYQARGNFWLPAGVPTVVWTSLIGHAFLDGYDRYRNDTYLRTAVSACEHILHDVPTFEEGDAACIGYTPLHRSVTHNASTLSASLLARTFLHTRNDSYRALAEKAIKYTARHQRPDGSWPYGEGGNQRWVDNFHTGYVLDSLKYYAAGAGDAQFNATLMKGYEYWKKTFFLEDGTPRYYNHKTQPLDIQCCSQAIDTLLFFHDLDADSLSLALKVANWTIDHMQDRSGYFYYRRYSSWLVNKTPTLHWGQATMLCALAGLYKSL